ncbi:MAG: transposase, partial [Leptospiraceae bacterium]|nr:transposase [Leptospiraceae bacterium]
LVFISDLFNFSLQSGLRAQIYRADKERQNCSFSYQIIEGIRKLYAVEACCCQPFAPTADGREKGYPPEKFLACRQDHSRHIVDRIFELLKNKQRTIPRDQPLGKAIRYALGQGIKLRLFLENGNMPINTNAVENAIRCSSFPARIG